MTTDTLTMAGLTAHAGAARLGSPHGYSTWTPGAIVEPTTFVAFHGKNRPTRPLSELSP